MRIVSCMGELIRLSETNYKRLLRAIASQEEWDLNKLGKSLGIYVNVTDMTPEQANEELKTNGWAPVRDKLFEDEVRIFCHYVYFHYDLEGLKLTEQVADQLREAAEERAKELISEGYREGELNCCIKEKEVRGWWQIQD